MRAVQEQNAEAKTETMIGREVDNWQIPIRCFTRKKETFAIIIGFQVKMINRPD